MLRETDSPPRNCKMVLDDKEHQKWVFRVDEQPFFNPRLKKEGSEHHGHGDHGVSASQTAWNISKDFLFTNAQLRMEDEPLSYPL